MSLVRCFVGLLVRWFVSPEFSIIHLRVGEGGVKRKGRGGEEEEKEEDEGEKEQEEDRLDSTWNLLPSISTKGPLVLSK